jgi:hypothetical protein
VNGATCEDLLEYLRPQPRMFVGGVADKGNCIKRTRHLIDRQERKKMSHGEEVRNGVHEGWSAVWGAPAMLNGGAALAQAGQCFGRSCAEWQREMQDFFAARVKADTELPTTLAGCRSPLDLAKAQQDWLAAATRDYLTESARMAQIGASAVQQSMASWLSTLQPPPNGVGPSSAAAS